MSLNVIIILVVLAAVVVAMVVDKLEFGLPPLIGVIVLALLGVVTPAEAFAGFTNQFFLMTCGFIVVSDAFGRTSLLSKIQRFALRQQERRGGMGMYFILLLITGLLASCFDSGPTVLLMLVVLAAIPKTDKFDPSKALFPIGSLADALSSKLPLGMSIMFTLWVNGYLQSAGFMGEVSVLQWCLAGLVPAVVAIAWAFFGYKLIPSTKLELTDADRQTARGNGASRYSKFQEAVVYIVFVASALGMFLTNQLGSGAYMIPCMGSVILVLTGCMTFADVRRLMSDGLIYMMACFFSLADIMNATGITEMIGNGVLGLLGGNPSAVLLTFVFAYTTVFLANITGSNKGTLMVMCPVAISAALAAGFDPRAMALATAISALASVVMPMDTAMGVCFSRGHYPVGRTFLYTIPMTILYIAAVCISCLVIFPA